MSEKDDKVGELVSEFKGYPAPTSNTTYTPNQLFDVVLRHSSRGVVRLVGYMIRKVLGWSDAHGNPQEPQVVISYRQLVEEAGISRGAIQPAIEDAINANYIRCVRKGCSSSTGVSAVSALFELCWDESGEYITRPQQFQGFFAGNGNLTYIPNAFFDHTVPNEPLAVVKVVGSIIRHTIGFQTKFGFRRQQIEMSFTSLQRTTGISSRRALNDAIQYALTHNHIQRVEAGLFDPQAGAQSKAASYAVKWCDSASYPLTGSKRIPEDSETALSRPQLPVQKRYRERFKKDTGEIPPDQFKKDTGTDSKRIPELVQKGYREQSKKDTGIEITPINNISNNTNKQQHPAAADDVLLDAYQELKSAGFDSETATLLSGSYPPEKIVQQVQWLQKRNPTRNALGMLRRSIEENWPSPEPPMMQSPGAAFASHFYAAWAGNEGTPAGDATAADIAAADRFVNELFQYHPDVNKVPKMGQSFGRYVKDKESGNPNMPRSLRLALTRHGDSFVVEFRLRIKQSRRKAAERARSNHFARYEEDYFRYLSERLDELRGDNPLLFASFEDEEQRQRDAMANSRFFKSEDINREMLAAFDNERERLKRFYEYFNTVEHGMVADFWTWDRTIHVNGFAREAIHT